MDRQKGMKQRKIAGMFRRMGAVMNVLQYYSNMKECDVFMREFSVDSRKIWVNNLSNWVHFMRETLTPVEICQNNIERYILSQCLQNFRFSIRVDHKAVKKSRFIKYLQEFIRRVPSRSQFDSIFLSISADPHYPYLTENDWKSKYRYLSKISKALDYEPFISEISEDSTNIVGFYLGEIFSVRRVAILGIAVFDNFQILPYPENEDRAYIIQSKYLIDKNSISLNSRVSKFYPNLPCYNLGDQIISPFLEVTEIELNIDHSETTEEVCMEILSMISVYYPALKKINYMLHGTDLIPQCKAILYYRKKRNLECFIYSPRIKTISSKIRIKASNVSIVGSAENGGVCERFTCSCDVYLHSPLLVQNLLICKQFEIHTMWDLDDSESSSNYNLSNQLSLPQAHPPAHESQAITINLSHATSLETDYDKLCNILSTKLSVNDQNEPLNLTSRGIHRKYSSNFVKTSEIVHKLGKECEILVRASYYMRARDGKYNEELRNVVECVRGRENKVTIDIPPDVQDNIAWDYVVQELFPIVKRVNLVLSLTQENTVTFGKNMWMELKALCRCSNFGEIKLKMKEPLELIAEHEDKKTDDFVIATVKDFKSMIKLPPSVQTRDKQLDKEGKCALWVEE
ncbi:unnamed protein product [Moneuplotes crassus]|uniref:Uncharacterized protein n=1 Tax=Euplotes crassus TaxID=5936 RepID=A0AAD1YBD4_EUPCR|nr:unnamed protein product [Moneuplotes crassus]